MFRSPKGSLVSSILAAVAFLNCPVYAGTHNTAHEAPFKSSSQAHKLAKEIVEAYGGAEKLKNLDELLYRAKGKITEYSMLSGASNTFDCNILTRGQKVRIQINLMDQPVVTTFDGKVCWTMQGDQVYPADATTNQRTKEEIMHGLLLLTRSPTKVLMRD